MTRRLAKKRLKRGTGDLSAAKRRIVKWYRVRTRSLKFQPTMWPFEMPAQWAEIVRMFHGGA